MSEKKPLPHLASDEEAELFIATADLSEYDLSGFERIHFEFTTKAKGGGKGDPAPPAPQPK